MNTNNSTIIPRTLLGGAILVAAYLAFVGWSEVARVPVAAIGLLFYVVVFALAPSVRSGAKSASAFIGLVGIAGIIAGAVVFLGLQLFAIGQFCLFCTVAHLLGVGGAVLALAGSERSLSDFHLPASLALIGIGGLFTFHASTQEPETSGLMVATANLTNGVVVEGNAVSVRGARQVTLHGGAFTVDLDKFPILGAENATRFGVALLDYSLQSRDVYTDLHSVSRSYGDDVAFAILPAFGGARERVIHRYLMTLRRIDEPAFASLDRDLRSGRVPANQSKVLAEIVRRVGSAQFQSAYADYAEAIDRDLDFAESLRKANAAIVGVDLAPQIVVDAQVSAGARPEMHFYSGALAATFGVSPEPSFQHLYEGETSGQIELSPATVDIGGVPAGSSIVAKLPLTNKGGLPLRVSWLRLGDGCSAFDVPRDEIAPGEIGEVSVRVDIPEQAGPLTRFVTVHNDATPLGTTIKIVGTAVVAVAEG